MLQKWVRPAPPAASMAVVDGSASQVGGDPDEPGEGVVEERPLLVSHTPWDCERPVDIEMTLK